MLGVLLVVMAQVAPEPEPTVVDSGVLVSAADAGSPEEAAKPALAVVAPPVSSEDEGTAPAQGFVKGELSAYLGSDRLTVKNTRIGVSAGPELFANVLYLTIEPMVDLRFLDGALGVGFGVPLRLELVNFEGTVTAKNLGRLRKEDWASFHDAGRILKYVTWGKKEDHFYLSAGQRYATSIGHGTITRRYAPNIDANYPRASAEVDAYNDYAGFELHTNDLLEWNTLAGIAFVKPLSFINKENLLTRSFSVGVSAALDWNAPWKLLTDANGVRQLDSVGRLKVSTRAVKLIGFDAEMKVYKSDSVDIKPYVDYSMLIDGDAGLTVGVLGRFNVGTSIVNAFRVVGEFRSLGNHYQSGYFDTFYEIDRFVFKERPRTDAGLANFATKQDWLLTEGLGQRAGYYFEGSWGIPNAIGVTLALEGAGNTAEKNLVAHLEVPVLSFLQVFGSFYKRGLTNFSELGQLDEKTVLFAGARLKVLPILFINARAYKTFHMNAALQRYDNQSGFFVDLEVGYEFAKSSAPPPPATVATEPPAQQ